MLLLAIGFTFATVAVLICSSSRFFSSHWRVIRSRRSFMSDSITLNSSFAVGHWLRQQRWSFSSASLQLHFFNLAFTLWRLSLSSASTSPSPSPAPVVAAPSVQCFRRFSARRCSLSCFDFLLDFLPEESLECLWCLRFREAISATLALITVATVWDDAGEDEPALISRAFTGMVGGFCMVGECTSSFGIRRCNAGPLAVIGRERFSGSTCTAGPGCCCDAAGVTRLSIDDSSSMST
uniref:Uncharacterized protein n=1 Tax=Anopheles atroparvus TaxID=41427 RepID=A0A182JD44_ANOAO